MIAPAASVVELSMPPSASLKSRCRSDGGEKRDRAGDRDDVAASGMHHAKRSSFYMIATNIQSRHYEAVLAVERWKRQWKVATFGTDVEYEEELRAACLNAEEVLGEFGIELVRLGREVWEIQARALEKAPFIKK